MTSMTFLINDTSTGSNVPVVQVTITFTARNTPLVAGRVTYVAPDRSVDRQSGLAYYTATIEVEPASLAAAGDLQLQAGMPAELYVKGEARSALAYLLEPVTQVPRRAGRER